MLGERPTWPVLDLGPGAIEKEAERLKRMLGTDFIVKVVPPFVVAGDISSHRMERICRHTIGDCLRALQKDFFTHAEPAHVLRVFLFDGELSYNTGAEDLFSHDPGTPYGYYHHAVRSLVMNIRTGGGTLVHEMVHALRNYDFPHAPTWLDEGIASLYEQCTIRDGKILGLVNWRLPVFEEGYEKGEYVPIRKVLEMSETTFRGSASSMHYAESRYFCYYLQQLGHLRTLYATFRDRFREDPTGVKFVEEITGKKLEVFEEEWLRFMGTLHAEDWR
jgi:hypothetical protein